MLLPLLLGLLALQEPTPPAEVKQQTPAEAAAAIGAALKGKDASAAQASLKASGKIADPAVVKAVADGLRHAEPLVRLAALEALRFNADPAATEALLKQRNNKKLLDDPNTAELYTYALGQKRDKRALPILKDGLVATGDTNGKVLTAKIYALGRIRDEESCEALMDFLNSAALKTEKYLTEIRISMAALTGVNAGPERKDLLNWWSENKTKLKILDEEAPLPEAAQEKWTRMWMSPEEMEAARKAAKAASGGSQKGDS